MKLVWSPETASKSFIDTVRACEINQESGVAELISAMAGGWNANLIVETWQKGGATATSIGLAIARRHTSGRHVCIVPDEASKTEYLRSVGKSVDGESPEVIVGEAEAAIGDPSLEGVDFLVVDCRQRDFSGVLRLARLGKRGAVLICKNATANAADNDSGFRWESAVDAGKYRVVRAEYLPVGDGIYVADVGVNRGGDVGGRWRWVKHFDHRTGEENFISTGRL